MLRLPETLMSLLSPRLHHPVVSEIYPHALGGKQSLTDCIKSTAHIVSKTKSGRYFASFIVLPALR